MATILLVGVDLMFLGKLEGLLPGHHLTTTDSVDPPDCVIADVGRIDPDEVADAYPDVPLLAGKGLVDGLAAVYFCERFACRAPVTRAEELSR